MSVVALALAICLLLASPRIIKSPFLGLLLVIAVNPVESLFPLPGRLTLGRIAGVITVASWVLHINQDADARLRWAASSLKSTIWMFPAVCVCSSVLGILSSATGVSAILNNTLNIILLCVMALMVESLANTNKKISQLMIVVIISSLIATIFPLSFHFGFDLYSRFGIDPETTFDGSAGRSKGLTGNANALGLSACMGLYAVIVEISANRKLKFIAVFFLIALALFGGLVLSGSRTHLAAFLIFTMTYLVLRLVGPPQGRGLAIFAVLAMLAMLPYAITFAPSDVQNRLVFFGEGVQDNTVERLNFSNSQREIALRSLEKNPLFGVGLMNFKATGLHNHNAHDSVSALLAETGILGTLSFLILISSCFFRLVKVLPDWRFSGRLEVYGYSAGLLASLVAILVAGFGGYVVFYQRWFWIVIGLSGVMYRFYSQARFSHNESSRQF